jgi:hypothetical protein
LNPLIVEIAFSKAGDSCGIFVRNLGSPAARPTRLRPIISPENSERKNVKSGPETTSKTPFLAAPADKGQFHRTIVHELE